MRFIVILFSVSLFTSIKVTAQKVSKLNAELIMALGTAHTKVDQINGDPRFYHELRVNYRINDLWEVGVFGAYQYRSRFEYRIIQNQPPIVYAEVASLIDRHYIPVGLTTKLNITSLFSEKMQLIKNKEKWGVYNLFSFNYLINRNKYYRQAPDNQYTYGSYPFNLYNGIVYFGLMVGVKYSIKKNWPVFVEAGKGALMWLQFGTGFKL